MLKNHNKHNKNDYKISVMNNPFHYFDDEINFLNSLNVNSLELTIEGPEFGLDKLKKKKDQLGIFKIGHTRSNLAFASDDNNIRTAAVHEFCLYVKFFSEIGISLINIHPDKGLNINRRLAIDNNLRSFKEIVKYAKKYNVQIMVENQEPFIAPEHFIFMFNQIPDLGLLFDIAHSYYLIGDYGTDEFIEKLSYKIMHIHLSDNYGICDDHLFLGKGKINFKKYLFKIFNNVSKMPYVSLEPYIINNGNNFNIVDQDKRDAFLRESILYIKNIKKP